MKYSDIEVPSWCSESEANHPLGCSSLISGYVEDHTYCTECDMFRPIISNEREVIRNNKVLNNYLSENK